MICKFFSVVFKINFNFVNFLQILENEITFYTAEIKLKVLRQAPLHTVILYYQNGTFKNILLFQ